MSHPFVTDYGTLLADFEDVSDWTVTGTGATGEDDTINFRSGSQSIKLIGVNGSSAVMTRTDLSLDLSSNDGFSLWCYVEDITKLLDPKITFYLSSVSNFAKHFKMNMPIYVPDLVNGWNRLSWHKARFENFGGESWDNTITSVRFIVKPVAGEDTSVSFDNFTFDERGKAKVIMSFDDGLTSQINAAYPIMAANDQKGVCFVNSALVGTGGYMTLANLKTLQAAGWDIASHGAEHLHLTEVSQAEMEADIDNCYDWLVDNGFRDSAGLFAYPSGERNAAVRLKLSQRHKLARTISQHYQPHFDILDYADLQFDLNVGYATGSDPTTADIDKTIAQGSVLVFVSHNVGGGGFPDFQNISDYLKTKQDAGDLEVITFSDYYNTLAHFEDRWRDRRPRIRFHGSG